MTKLMCFQRSDKIIDGVRVVEFETQMFVPRDGETYTFEMRPHRILESEDRSDQCPTPQ